MKKLLKRVAIASLCVTLSACSPIDYLTNLLDSQQDKEQMEEITSQASSVIPNFENRYFLSQLTDEDLAFVVLAYQGLMNFEDDIQIDVKFDNQDRPNQLLQLMQYDCPELYQFTTNAVGATISYSWQERDNDLVSFHIDYLMDQQTYNDSYNQITSTIQSLVDTANTYYVSDMDKELYVYDYIADTTTYNENATNNSSAYGVFIDQEAACLGISRAFQWVLDDLGISCITVGGYPVDGSNVGHAWNIVTLDNESYCVDLTADVKQIDFDNYKIYVYMNVTDSVFANTYNLEECLFNVPEATGIQYNYYIYTGQYVYQGEDGTQKVKDAIKQLLSNGGGQFNIQFESLDDYNYVVTQIETIFNESEQEIGIASSNASYASNDELLVLHFQIN